MEHNSNKEELNTLLPKLTKIIDPVIKELLLSYVDQETQKIVGYQIFTGGKRIRPALAIISCRLLGGKTEDVLYPAAGLEILHNYSLIIDDIIDNSNLRRDKPTTWYKFGRSIAECLAIDYSAAVFQAANQSKKPTVISELFAKTMKTIVDGEILDVLFEQTGREKEPYILENRYKKITKNDYFKMVSQKTAVLFQACCEVGAICAEAKREEIESLKNYGFNLGIAFQIQDDILDIFGEEKKFGKKIGKDIEENKGGNIVTIYALEEIMPADRREFAQIMGKKQINKKEIKEAIKLIKKTNAYQRAFFLGTKYIQRTKKSLDCLPKNKWNKILSEIADFVIKRNK